MAKVTINLPSLLDVFTKGERTFVVEATTVNEALHVLTEKYPALNGQLFDESGVLRQHVLCFHNDVNTRWGDTINAPLAEGDTITILQAVSGG